MVKNLPAMQETWFLSLGWEDLLEKEMATHSSILAWRIPWMEEPGRLQSMGLERVDTTERLTHKEWPEVSVLQVCSSLSTECHSVVATVARTVPGALRHR